MANIRFASNNVTHFPGSVASNRAGAFDSNRVPYGLTLDINQSAFSPTFEAVDGNVTWFHFNAYAPRINQYASGVVFRAWDASDNLLCTVTKKDNVASNDVTLYGYDGITTNTNSSPNYAISAYVLNTIDIRIEVTALIIEIKIYGNSSLVAEVNFANNPNAYGKPVRFSLGGGWGYEEGPCHFSEILVADEDTRNARLNFLRPAGQGFYDNWNGAVIDIADDDPTTGMSTAVADARHSVILSGYTGAAAISNIVSVSASTRGTNSPSGINHFVRLSGVDYDSSDLPVDFTYRYGLTDLKLNPGTSVPWTSSDLSAIEMGFRSRT